MFTGIVSAIGHIVEARALGQDPAHGKRLVVQAPAGYLGDVATGDSIALNGACMTVTSLDAALGVFHDRCFGGEPGMHGGAGGCGAVNLEKALRANDRLGGHS